jgi:hypothetical protein
VCLMEIVGHRNVSLNRLSWSQLSTCSRIQWHTQEFCLGGGSPNSVEDRENGDLGAVAPLVRSSGGSCNLVQEISFHIIKFS